MLKCGQSEWHAGRKVRTAVTTLGGHSASSRQRVNVKVGRDRSSARLACDDTRANGCIKDKKRDRHNLSLRFVRFAAQERLVISLLPSLIASYSNGRSDDPPGHCDECGHETGDQNDRAEHREPRKGCRRCADAVDCPSGGRWAHRKGRSADAAWPQPPAVACVQQVDFSILRLRLSSCRRSKLV